MTTNDLWHEVETDPAAAALDRAKRQARSALSSKVSFLMEASSHEAFEDRLSLIDGDIDRIVGEAAGDGATYSLTRAAVVQDFHEMFRRGEARRRQDADARRARVARATQPVVNEDVLVARREARNAKIAATVTYTNYTNMDSRFMRGYEKGDTLVRGYTGTIDALDSAADAIYMKHNRDDRPDGQMCPSLSMGDVINIDGKWVTVLDFGFGEVTVDPDDITTRSWLEVIREYKERRNNEYNSVKKAATQSEVDTWLAKQDPTFAEWARPYAQRMVYGPTYNRSIANNLPEAARAFQSEGGMAGKQFRYVRSQLDAALGSEKGEAWYWDEAQGEYTPRLQGTLGARKWASYYITRREYVDEGSIVAGPFDTEDEAKAKFEEEGYPDEYMISTNEQLGKESARVIDFSDTDEGAIFHTDKGDYTLIHFPTTPMEQKEIDKYYDENPDAYGDDGWYADFPGQRPPHRYRLIGPQGEEFTTFSASGDDVVGPFQDAMERAHRIIEREAKIASIVPKVKPMELLWKSVGGITTTEVGGFALTAVRDAIGFVWAITDGSGEIEHATGKSRTIENAKLAMLRQADIFGQDPDVAAGTNPPKKKVKKKKVVSDTEEVVEDPDAEDEVEDEDDEDVIEDDAEDEFPVEEEQVETVDPMTLDVGDTVTVSYTMGTGETGEVEGVFVRNENDIVFFSGPNGEFGVAERDGAWIDSEGNQFSFSFGSPDVTGESDLNADVVEKDDPARPAEEPPVADKEDEGDTEYKADDDKKKKKKNQPPWLKGKSTLTTSTVNTGTPMTTSSVVYVTQPTTPIRSMAELVTAIGALNPNLSPEEVFELGKQAMAASRRTPAR